MTRHTISSSGGPASIASPSTAELARWREDLLRSEQTGWSDLDDRCKAFPYALVLNTFHQIGKQHVPAEYLQYLDGLDNELNTLASVADSSAYRLLRSFFCELLDKHRNQYCYDSYIGSRILEQMMACPTMTFEEAWHARTRRVVGLMADVVEFECLTYLGEMSRHPSHLVSKRLGCRRIHGGVHAIKTFGAAVPDLLHDSGIDALVSTWKTLEGEADRDVLRRTAAIAQTITGRLSPDTRQMIGLAMVPVSTVHDEYMFIRLVQAFEAMFIMLASGFRETIHRLTENRLDEGLRTIRTMIDTLRTSLSFFRVLNTMPSENFLEFRDQTDGASAIQSKQYKWIEVLAAHPSEKRINSEGFDPVPHVRNAYRRGLRNIEDAYADCRVCSPRAYVDECRSALLALDRQWVAWKRSHVNVVIRALGSVKGTGGTAGLIYLQQYSTMRLFPFLYREESQPGCRVPVTASGGVTANLTANH